MARTPGKKQVIAGSSLQVCWSRSYTNVRHCEELSMAPFQLKEALGLFVQRCGFYYQFPLVAIWPRLPTLTLILKRKSWA